MQFIDDNGQWRLGDARFDGFGPLSDGRVWINRGGVRAFEPREWSGDHIRGAALGGKWGLADESGKLLIEPCYEGAWPFCEGRAWANVGGHGEATHGWSGFDTVGGLWALVDLDGRELLPPTFVRPRQFSNGTAWVKLEQWGLIDLTGKLVKPLSPRR